jgi:hypothetical protein
MTSVVATRSPRWSLAWHWRGGEKLEARPATKDQEVLYDEATGQPHRGHVACVKISCFSSSARS